MKKPWSGRFKGRTSRAVEAFTESVSFDWRLWPYDIEGSVAHARMLGRQGIITKTEARKIESGLKAIAREIVQGKFCPSLELEDVHMNIEAALIEKIGSAGGKLHTGRSRNDQVALDLRLYLRDEASETAGLVMGLAGTLLDVAGDNIETVMPGYTHLQRAQPVLLAHHLLAYVEMFLRDLDRLGECLERINVLPLGAAALAGTSLPIDRRSVARDLGFVSVAENSIDAVSDRDFVVEFCSVASLVMVHLSRLSEELVLWSTEEFSFIRLPDAFATGSSIMPQKKNPDVPELVRGKAGRVFGNLMALLATFKGLPLAYNRDMQEDKQPLFDTVDTVKSCLLIMAEMLPALEFRADVMASAAGGGHSTATDLAKYLVTRGMPFREAHEVTGRVVRYAEKEGKALDNLSTDELRSFSSLIEDKVRGRLGVMASVKSRRSLGGTSPAQVRRRIKKLKEQFLK